MALIIYEIEDFEIIKNNLFYVVIIIYRSQKKEENKLSNIGIDTKQWLCRVAYNFLQMFVH